MTKMTGGEAVVEALIANGVDTLFGLPGAQLDPIFAALHDRQDRIRVMHSRHEQGSAYMAYGFAEASGRIGTSLVVPGPGFLNTTAAIATAYACNTPMLNLVGQGRSSLIGRGFGILHEIPNQLETARGLVKWAGRVSHASEIPRKIAAAIGEIRDHRPRPVYLEIPFDISKAAAEIPAPVIAAEEQKTPPVDTDQVAAAATALASAKCPLIIAGGGARDAGEQILAIAEILNAPVAMTQNGLGTIDGRHELAFTQLGAHHWWRQADVILALGTRLFPAAMTWGRDSDLRIIKVDIDADELRRLPPPLTVIHGDTAEVLHELRGSLDAAMSGPAPDRTDVIADVRAAVNRELESVAPQRALLDIIRQEIGEDGILVSDLTQLYFAAQDVFPVYRPRTYIHPSYQGTLGHAAATALGAQVAAGDRPVVGLAGDGGFMFTVQELATAVQHGIAATFLVMNNGVFENVERILKNDYDNRVICADLNNPDFVKLAESFGIPGRRANSPDTLRTALKESIAEAGPTLIEYQAAEFPSPWPLHFREKVRG